VASWGGGRGDGRGEGRGGGRGGHRGGRRGDSRGRARRRNSWCQGGGGMSIVNWKRARAGWLSLRRSCGRKSSGHGKSDEGACGCGVGRTTRGWGERRCQGKRGDRPR
jgi:hypothetical protein